MSSRSGPLDQRPGRAEVRQADARPIDGDQTHAEAGRQAVIGVAGEARIAEAVDKTPAAVRQIAEWRQRSGRQSSI